jgi:uncharacterized protein (TIGR03435 family)
MLAEDDVLVAPMTTEPGNGARFSRKLLTRSGDIRKRVMANTCRRSASMIALLAAGAALAQQPAPRRAFEVAEVKASLSHDDNTSSHGSKGQVIMNNMPLNQLIQRAYDLKPLQVSGPDWLANVRFNIVAKYPADTTPADRTLMLQTLLEDRFKLSVHRDSKEMSGFALSVAKSGFKLKPVEPGDSSRHSNGGRVRTDSATRLSMGQVAEFLTRALGQTVVDKTGLGGVYTFELKWMPEDPAADPAKNVDAESAPSMYTALQQQLGLRLQPQKVAVEILVVDHAERVPSEK